MLDFEKAKYIEILFNDKVMAKCYKFFEDKGKLVLSIPQDMRICENATIRIIVYMLTGKRLEQLTKIIRFEKGMVVFELPAQFNEIPERRKFVKVKTELTGVMRYHGSKDFDIIVKDMSMGGIFVETKEFIAIGTVCEIEIKALDINLETRICIHRRQDDESGYGCIFLKLNANQEDAIMKHVFQKQIEERKKLLR